MCAVAAFSPDLIVLDVMMEQPDDGIAMAQDLHRTGFHMPILMMTSISRVTGMAYEKDREMIPVDEFLEKPVRPQTFIYIVKKLLDK
jgi:FixJ family two-component response regulator